MVDGTLDNTPDEVEQLADALYKHYMDEDDIDLRLNLRKLARATAAVGAQRGDYHEGWEEGYKAGAQAALKDAAKWVHEFFPDPHEPTENCEDCSMLRTIEVELRDRIAAYTADEETTV